MENQSFNYFYLYGRTFNLDEKGKDIIIYTQISGRESRILRSLEGVFFSNICLDEKNNFNKDKSGYIFRREEMENLVNKYSGKFVEF